jgi:hypothetical protein
MPTEVRDSVACHSRRSASSTTSGASLTNPPYGISGYGSQQPVLVSTLLSEAKALRGMGHAGEADKVTPPCPVPYAIAVPKRKPI